MNDKRSHKAFGAALAGIFNAQVILFNAYESRQTLP
jgi:hypothetical protein